MEADAVDMLCAVSLIVINPISTVSFSKLKNKHLPQISVASKGPLEKQAILRSIE